MSLYIIQNASTHEQGMRCSMLCITRNKSALYWQSSPLVYKISINALDIKRSFLSQITYFTNGLNCSLKTRCIVVSSQIKDTEQLIIFINCEKCEECSKKLNLSQIGNKLARSHKQLLSVASAVHVLQLFFIDILPWPPAVSACVTCSNNEDFASWTALLSLHTINH